MGSLLGAPSFVLVAFHFSSRPLSGFHNILLQRICLKDGGVGGGGEIKSNNPTTRSVSQHLVPVLALNEVQAVPSAEREMLKCPYLTLEREFR